MIKRNVIVKVAKRLGTAANAERLILFGSHVRGQAQANSDVDIKVGG